MKKWRYFSPVIVCIIIFAYLWSANAYIYHRIAQGNLPFTDTEHVYSIGSGEKKTYVALGDSLTFGVGAQTYQESYPYLLAQKLAGNGAIELKDLSFPGVKSADIISGFLPEALTSDPDIVTLLIGTNDLHNWVPAAQFEANYRTIVDALEKTDAAIYLISIPFIGSDSLYYPPLDYYFARETRKFNEIIKRIAIEHKITYIDIATPTRDAFKNDGPLYAADSFHPSALGYKLWSQIIYAGIHR